MKRAAAPFLGFVSAGVLLAVPARADAQANEPKALVAGLCDYVAADYPGAVKGGRVIRKQEYAEQATMLAEAETQAALVAPALALEVNELHAMFASKAPEGELVARARAIRKLLVQRYGLPAIPPAASTRPRAETLFKLACAPCHGPDGRAQTPQAAQLRPPPVSFFDEARMSRISPALAFYAITNGVAGTGMAAFGALSVPDRWSLAYLVVAMRHARVDDARGLGLYLNAGVPISPNAAAIAQVSDAELEATLSRRLPDAHEREEAIAWLRTTATFRVQWDGTFTDARRRLAEVAKSAADPKRALPLAITAYVDGVEPHERSMGRGDRSATLRIERGFARLRATIQAGRSEGEIRAEVARLDRILQDPKVEEPAPFAAALAIGLRQGFELSLLLVGLLIFRRKTEDRRSRLARWVYPCGSAAVLAGVGTWFVIGAHGGAVDHAQAQGGLTLLAVATVLVGRVALGKAEGSKSSRFLWCFGMAAFVVTYREAVETALYGRAQALAGPGAGLAIAAGEAAGLSLLAAPALGMLLVRKRLSPRAALLSSSATLSLLAISLVGQGMRSLQDAGHLHVLPIARAPLLPLLGIHATAEGLAGQVGVLVALLSIAWLERRRGRERPLRRRTRTPLWVRAVPVVVIGGLAAGSVRAEAVYRTPRQTLTEFFPRSQRVRYLRFPVDAALRERLTHRLGYGPGRAEYAFYMATTGNHVDGYALIDDEPGQSEPITFAVQLTPDGTTVRTEILIYREPRGDEVRSRRFLEQLRGKTVRQPVRTGVDIDAVSGATISSRSLTAGVRRALVLFDELILRARVHQTRTENSIARGRTRHARWNAKRNRPGSPAVTVYGDAPGIVRLLREGPRARGGEDGRS
jgi:high-affinity iron transporter